MSIEMGIPQSRLSRAIEARLEDSVANSLSAPGGPVPNSIDCSAIIPTWDINQSGMLDPKDPTGEKPTGLNYTNTFSQPIVFTGSVAGVNNRTADLVKPQGFSTGYTQLTSVNESIPTRNQNVLLHSLESYIQYDAAGAAADAGVIITAELRLKHCPSSPFLGGITSCGFASATVAAGTTYYKMIFGQLKIFVPWDCSLSLVFVKNGGVFPANTSAAGMALCFMRNKNSMLPQW